MAIPTPETTLGSYIDTPFNVSLSIILALTFVCAIRNRVLLLAVVLAVSATIAIFDKTSTAREMTKVMAELPLGLGSVLAFLVASRAFQTRWLRAFAMYVNVAVFGNIGMMVWTPADGTLRGMCSKVACLALFVWICQQGYHARWKTIVLHQSGLFVFTAVSKSWIFAHAIYRFVLLTLPCFGSGRRHRLLEVYSLGFTWALSVVSGLPFEYCFGMADTLVVPASAGWSAVVRTFDLLPRGARDHHKSALLESTPFARNADVVLSMLSLAVAVFAVYKIVSGGSRSSSTATKRQDNMLYGVEHGKLNIVAKPATMWMNIGFWCVHSARRCKSRL